MREYKSKSRHYLDTLLKQPGINTQMTLEDIREILDDDDKARLLDKQLESPFYNQSGVVFIRLMLDSIDVLLECAPKSIKVFLKLAQHASQSNMICISKKDLYEYIGMSIPTINSALEELQEKALITIETRNIASGEANVYCLNPKICGSGKLTSQEIMSTEYERHISREKKDKFKAINSKAKSQFAEKFDAGDKKLNQNSPATYTDIIKRGKCKNQDAEKTKKKQPRQKKASTANADPNILTETAPTSVPQTDCSKLDVKIQEDNSAEIVGQMKLFDA